MADLARLTTIKKIVAETLALSGQPKSRFYPMFQTAINCVQDLNLFHLNCAKRVLLDMSASYTIDFPSDYLGFISLSIPINGRNHTFTEDNTLLAIETTDHDWTDGLDEKSTTSFGTRGGKNTDVFRIDAENKRFVFNSPEQRTEVILTYVSSGISLTAETEVPLIVKSTVMAYVLWRSALMSEKTYYNRTEILRQDYEREVEKLRMLELPGIDSIRDEIRRSYRMSPKR